MIHFVENTIDMMVKEDTLLRLWIDCSKRTQEPIEIVDKIRQYVTLQDAPDALGKFDTNLFNFVVKEVAGVTAVQIVCLGEDASCGTVIYTVPFSDDVHG